MIMTGETPLRRTSLYDLHVASGGRIVPFAGWELPVQYSGVAEEHQAVRTAVGLFDVSHMGEIRVQGPRALEAIQRLVTNDAARLAVGRGMYSPMCTPEGGIVDDLTVFRVGEQVYLMVVNAATRIKDLAWIQAHAGGAIVEDVSDATALLALQGPRAAAVLGDAFGREFSMKAFGLVDGVAVRGVLTTVSRTGYTGEDGFEIACPWDSAPVVWSALVEAGRAHGLVPVGLGARDTLRLEAGFMLYGQDIDETTSPLEAPLSWTVKLEKGDFLGREALARQQAGGVSRRLVGLETVERAIPRHGYAITVNGQHAGEVTSGTFSPTLRKPVGMGYVPASLSEPGTAVSVEVRGKATPAYVVKLPFYRRPKS
jgi:aminomethyltransferase